VDLHERGYNLYKCVGKRNQFEDAGSTTEKRSLVFTRRSNRFNSLRLLPFPGATAAPIIQDYLRRASGALKPFAAVVKDEIETRSRWPFLRKAASATESVFPSWNGTRPQTSPDGHWIAYEETGWGRPGGTGGFGSSNLISISHVVRIDGTDDRIVSDMFLVGWMSDSKRVGTARDGFAAISDFDDNVVAEFWSPDGRYVQLSGDSSWLIIDLQANNAMYEIENVDDSTFPGDCSSRCDGNPWSKDVARLAFVRNGQIWVSDAQGRNAKQVTFDSTRKMSPVFSRDGSSLFHYHQIGCIVYG
jgi:hypothetical protein